MAGKPPEIAPPGVAFALAQLSKSVLIDLVVSRVLAEDPRAKSLDVCKTLDRWLADVYLERGEEPAATLVRLLGRYRESTGAKKPPKSWEKFMSD